VCLCTQDAQPDIEWCHSSNQKGIRTSLPRNGLLLRFTQSLVIEDVGDCECWEGDECHGKEEVEVEE
jgi:hypothetical protein